MTSIWSISLALVTLGQHLGRKPRPFTVAELLAWAPGLQRERTAHTVCNLLAHKGLLVAAPAPEDNPAANQCPERPARWQLTGSGREAARTAQLEAASRKRAETMAAVNAARHLPDALPTRLWTVLRARRTLTSLQAVELLADAGQDTAALGKQIGAYLRAWHALAPQTVQVAARRVGQCRKYVLVGDAGRFPPEALRNPGQRAARQARAAAPQAKAAP